VLVFLVCLAGTTAAVLISGPGRSAISHATPTPTPELAGKYPIRFDGYGPVKVGMKPVEAMKAFKLVENRWDEDEGCYYLEFDTEDTDKTPGFMVNDGTIARVDVTSPDYLTEEGAKVGDTEQRIKEIYGKGVKVSPHAYVDGHYLTVTSKDKKYAIIFETDGKVVTYIRAGRPPEVGYIEGCA